MHIDKLDTSGGILDLFKRLRQRPEVIIVKTEHFDGAEMFTLVCRDRFVLNSYVTLGLARYHVRTKQLKLVGDFEYFEEFPSIWPGKEQENED